MPPEELIIASREVVQNYLAGDQSMVGSIWWAEFELDGEYVRGGITNVEMMSSRLISEHTDEPIIQEIISYVADRGIKAGELIPSKIEQGSFWCVPYRPVQTSGKPVDRVRVLFLTEALFFEILDVFNFQDGLTPSEKHVIYQILIGQSPGTAANVDGVSVETKRSQLKSAASKLNCHSQTEIVRLLVSQLIHLLYLCESESSNIQLIEQFGSQFFAGLGRLTVQRLPNDRIARYWEFGPHNGRPVLAMHGYLFPFLFLEAERDLELNNIRLVLPVRTGFLDNHPDTGSHRIAEIAKENLEDLVLFTKAIFKEPVPLLGHNMGGVYAMILAKQQPQLFQKVIIASINLMHNKEKKPTFASKFARGIRKLANDAGIYEFAARQFRKNIFGNERMTRIVLRRLFKKSPSDLDLINGIKGRGPAFEWFRQLALHSVVGVSSDLHAMSGPIENFIKDVPIDVTFIHGPDDPYTSQEQMEEYVRLNPRASCQMLDGGGHYISASHAGPFWHEVSRCIAEPVI